MSAPPLRVAFAGANAERGWAKDAHLPAVTALPGLQLTAVSARDQGLADHAARAFGVAKAYGDTLAMVRDPDIDIIAVTAKVPEHRSIIFAALAAGKHLYCEWPLGRDLAEAREMADAATAAGVHVAIGLQGAHSCAVRHAAHMVQSGIVGRPLTLRVVSPTAGWGPVAPEHYLYLEDKRNGATLSTIAGGHTLAAMEAVAGEIVAVQAVNSILLQDVAVMGGTDTVIRTCPDHVYMIARHASGCVSSLELTGGEARPIFQFELRGTEGVVEIAGQFAGGYQGADLSVSLVANHRHDARPAPKPAAPDLRGPARNVSELYAMLARDIRDGSQTAPDFGRAVRLTNLLDTIDTASDEQRCILVRN